MNGKDKYEIGRFLKKKFNKQNFDKYYTEYEQYLYTNKPVKYQIVAPLENFSCTLNSSVIKLSSKVRIVSADNTFYPDIISENLNRWMYPQVEYYEPPEFFLEIDYEMNKEEVPYKERIEQIARNELQEFLKS